MPKQTVKIARTLIKFAKPITEYTAGGGSSTTWELITVPKYDEEGTEFLSDCFYCEWKGSYGNIAIQQQAEGVIRPARVRMPFVQKIYDELISGNIRIYLYGKTDAAHTFVLASAADNYLNENKMIEFNVSQYVKQGDL